MSLYRELLEKVRDLKITQDDLPPITKQMEAELIEDPVVLERKHVLHVLKRYSQERLSQEDFMSWVHFVWFSDYFTPHEDDADCITSVFHFLQELEEEGDIMPEDLDECLEALTNNTQVEGLFGDDDL